MLNRLHRYHVHIVYYVDNKVENKYKSINTQVERILSQITLNLKNPSFVEE